MPNWRELSGTHVPYSSKGFSCHGESAKNLFKALNEKIMDCHVKYVPHMCRADLPLGKITKQGSTKIIQFGNSVKHAPSFCESKDGEVSCFIGAVIN
jgi:hypothetical protein